MYSRPTPRRLPYRKARDAPKPAIDETTLWPDEGSDLDPEYDPAVESEESSSSDDEMSSDESD